MNLLESNTHLPKLALPITRSNLPSPAATDRQILELRRLQQIWDMREETHLALGGQGFIKFVDVMGTDDRIVEAARLTAQSTGEDYGDDRTLLRYLMRHLHTTPIEFGEIVVHIRVPMDCWRQWVRHRTANINEYSTRYSPAIDAMACTPADRWRKQSTSNRQGSSGEVVEEYPDSYQIVGKTFDGLSPGEYLSAREKMLHQLAMAVYDERLLFGVAKEVARKDLPLSTFTEAYWKIDLHNLLHYLALRMDSHAQEEIREYATIIGEHIVKKLFPVTWEAFVDYRLEAMRLTRLDIGVIQRLCGGARPNFSESAAMWQGMTLSEASKYMPPFPPAVFLEMQDPAWKDLKRCRERVECWAKLEKLGLVKYSDGDALIN